MRQDDTYDFNLKAARLNISPTDLKEIVKEFINSSHEYLKPIEDAISNNDFTSMAFAAHRLKGAALELRIDNLAKAVTILEQSAKQEKTAEYYNFLAEIEYIINLLAEKIKTNSL